MINKSFLIPIPRPNATVRFICFPYAGGSASSYMPLAKNLPGHVELVAIQPRGRGHRFHQDASGTMSELLQDIEENFHQLINKPYVIYGHSLGARVAYELIHKIKQRGLPEPESFIAAASRAPHLSTLSEPVSNLSDREFIYKLKRLGGTNSSILDNKELLELCLPMLRADFKIVDDYKCQSKSKLSCKLYVISGSEDHLVSLEDSQGWSLHFTECKSFVISAGHFFIDSHSDDLVDVVEGNVFKKIS